MIKGEWDKMEKTGEFTNKHEDIIAEYRDIVNKAKDSGEVLDEIDNNPIISTTLFSMHDGKFCTLRDFILLNGEAPKEIYAIDVVIEYLEQVSSTENLESPFLIFSKDDFGDTVLSYHKMGPYLIVFYSDENMGQVFEGCYLGEFNF